MPVRPHCGILINHLLIILLAMLDIGWIRMNTDGVDTGQIGFLILWIVKYLLLIGNFVDVIHDVSDIFSKFPTSL